MTRWVLLSPGVNPTVETVVFWLVALTPLWIAIALKVFPERSSEAIEARRAYDGPGAGGWREAAAGAALFIGAPVLLGAIYIKFIE